MVILTIVFCNKWPEGKCVICLSCPMDRSLQRPSILIFYDLFGSAPQVWARAWSRKCHASRCQNHAKTMHVLTQLDPTSWIEEVSLPLTRCVVWSCFINPYVLYFLVSFLWVAHMLRSQVSGIHEIVPSCPCNTVQANKSTQLVQTNDQTCARKKKKKTSWINRITAGRPAA